MGWLLILLQVLSALPTVIKAVKEIWDLIHGLPKAMQADAKAELKSILKPAKGMAAGGMDKMQALADMKARLRAQTKNRV